MEGASRGQTHSAVPSQIEMLTYLSGVTKGPVQKAEVLINIITVTFDMNQPTQVNACRAARTQPLACHARH